MGYECPLNYNPADFYIHTLAIIPGEEEEHQQRVSRICNGFKESAEWKLLEGEVGIPEEENGDGCPNDLASEKGSEMAFKYKVSWFTQFYAVCCRCWIINFREPYIIRIRLLHSLVGTVQIQ